jgi:hypothetical protein
LQRRVAARLSPYFNWAVNVVKRLKFIALSEITAAQGGQTRAISPHFSLIRDCLTKPLRLSAALAITGIRPAH